MKFDQLAKAVAEFGLTVKRHSATHWQVMRDAEPIIDIWPTTSKYRQRDPGKYQSNGRPATRGSADDVLDLACELAGFCPVCRMPIDQNDPNAFCESCLTGKPVLP